MGAIKIINKILKDNKNKKIILIDDSKKHLKSKDYILIDTNILALRSISPTMEIDAGITYYYKEYEYNAYKIYRNENIGKNIYDDYELFISYFFEFSKIMDVDHFIYVDEFNNKYYYDIKNEDSFIIDNMYINDINKDEVPNISFYILGDYLKNHKELYEFIGKPKISVFCGDDEIISLK